MTWLEKFKAEHPALSEEYIEEEYCPTDGLVSMCPVDERGETLDCAECWRREIPVIEDGNGK